MLGAAVSGTACRVEPRAAERRRLRLTSGTPGAGFYPLGQALARGYERAHPDLEVAVLESEGAASNLQVIQRGEADLGLTHANVAYLAYFGLEGDQVPATRIRAIARLNVMCVHILVRGGSGIESVEQLRGRRLGLGVGHGSVAAGALMLNAFGLDLNEVELVPARYDEAPARLSGGGLDAYLVTGGSPLEMVARATRLGARLLELEGPPVTRLLREYPFFRRALIPAGTYPGFPAAVHTIGVDSLLICSVDLPEPLVHDLTAELFDILPSLPLESSFGLMDLEQAPATPIPLHDGAARYYREWELSR